VDIEECPQCGYQLKDFEKKDYVDKLINALNHRSGEVRHRVILILAQRKERKAIPYLENLLCESKDPSLVRAAKEAIEKISAQD